MMKIFLLLLSLMAGCEASTEVKVCRDGWVEFYCKYKASETYQIIDVVPPNNSEIRSTQKDQWENKGRYSLYHDTKNKRLKVAIKQLQQENFGEYECEFFQDQNSPDEVEDEVKVAAETDGCQGQFNQTVYRTAKTTITCDYPENKHRFSDKFLCRENKFTCEEILSTSSSVKSNRKYNLTETNRGFSVSISNVSSHDAGLYWCGVNEGNYRTGLRKIQLKVEGEQHTSDTSRFDSLTHITEVSLKYVVKYSQCCLSTDITTFTRSPTIGQNFTYWCEYPNGAPIKKFICKGEDPSICQPLITTQQKKNTKFSMKEDKEKRNITITVREVTADDSGTYWCGAESTDRRRSNTFFHRFLMTVEHFPPLGTLGEHVLHIAIKLSTSAKRHFLLDTLSSSP
ncbi:polymeric immunoglobulin receptor-like isoform X9 [Dicentrarchus labrax]|uniref:polymeric immunoglobulin receptor-like isoform X9 n=1 Tax=Dicentrarchus labrax TaxID=13489 RepID=UPI0021F5EA78|nr:polymeric immunoglobulin receptor-like isoform X9 [Dicentrarchus labrax]